MHSIARCWSFIYMLFHIGLFHFEELFAINLRQYLHNLRVEYHNSHWQIFPSSSSGMSDHFAQDLNRRLDASLSKYQPVGDTWQITAEDIVVHELPIDYATSYHLIIDRGSHLVTHAVGVFMTFIFRGIYIINNPMSFHYYLNNKDVGYAIARSLGINIPATYIVPPVYLNGRPYPFRRKTIDWEKIEQDIGFPCYIKPAAGHGGFKVYRVNNINELRSYYQSSGIEVMTIQKAILSPYNWQVRCLCIGRQIVPIQYRFTPSAYIHNHNFLTPEQGRTIIDHARIINAVFGYEMNSVEFILTEDGTPWAIDFNNPIPDARIDALGPIFYDDYLKMMIQRVIEVMAFKPRVRYLPETNPFADIARRNIPIHDKTIEAIKLANQYYDSPGY